MRVQVCYLLSCNHVLSAQHFTFISSLGLLKSPLNRLYYPHLSGETEAQRGYKKFSQALAAGNSRARIQTQVLELHSHSSLSLSPLLSERIQGHEMDSGHLLMQLGSRKTSRR